MFDHIYNIFIKVIKFKSNEELKNKNRKRSYN